MTEGMPWAQIGVIIGGIVAGLIFGVIWLSKFMQARAAQQTGEHASLIRREEFTTAVSELRLRLEDAAMEAREARAAAAAAQASMNSIGGLIESSMRQLGDRLENALRDVRDRVNDQAEQINDHHGRLRSVETELKLKRDE